jgi:hypothetical protein
MITLSEKPPQQVAWADEMRLGGCAGKSARCGRQAV